ncbi:hypothetical protein [Chlamydia sp. 17-3921]|uniref:hypothetical protein n=1 Tax=Chlamydia sp. 17-3921 TaxID=2675798 RepID=UPI001918AFC0|nr:hypothetical protein [Chlamydia sp. 17-3921]
MVIPTFSNSRTNSPTPSLILDSFSETCSQETSLISQKETSLDFSKRLSPLPAIASLPKEPYNLPNTCIGRLRSVAEKINRFLRDNWKYILLYLLAWALIVACHHTVAITLTIWLGIGLGLGVIFGVFSANFLDRENKHSNMNSLWNLMNYGLQQLDPNGTRQILLATIIASISALIYAIPQAVGVVIGFCIGNQISITATYGIRFGDEANYVADAKVHQKKLEKIQRAINERQLLKLQLIMQKQILTLVEKSSLEVEKTELKNSLNLLRLEMNTPLPHIFNLPPAESSATNLLENLDTLIAKTNLQLLALSRQQLHLKQEPGRVME